MAALRLRYRDGVRTIQIPLDDDTFTVRHLQQQVHDATGISPSRQQLKSGYPLRTLTAIPDLPISSLGISRGDQLVVTEIAQSNSHSSSLLGRSNVPQAQVSQNRRASSGPDYVDVDDSVLVHRVVPDDNSCLFSAVSLIFEQDMTKSQKMREIVSEAISNDPSTYNEAILGMTPERYMSAIRKPLTWGGAIELTILATHYNAEIASIDVETGRVDRFTPASQADQARMRCILIYSGIHYDAASLAPTPDAPGEWHQVLFPVSAAVDNDPFLFAAKKLADILRTKRAYTNTATFDLKCEICGTGLKGEKEARVHAEQTGHVRFGEY